MDGAQYRSLQSYVGFDPSSRAALAELHAVARPHLSEIADDFYRTIDAHPGARRAITGGAEQVQRLKATLLAWLQSVLAGPYDDEYLRAHSRIGAAHVRIGLPQEYMFGAMNRIRSQLTDVAVGAFREDAQRLRSTVHALNQILDLELAIMLESYRVSLIEEIRKTELRRGLEESERRHREVVEAVPAFVLALDAQGRIQLWNRRLEQVSGHSREEVIGQPGGDLVGDGARKLPLKDGGHRLVRWQRAAIAGPEGEPVTYAMGVDVTEERELLRRTLRAERLAAVGTLAAGLAHEVRNPLNSATLQLQVLERRIERGKTSQSDLGPIIGNVSEEIRRLDRLVSDFLSFAQPRPLRLEPVRIDDLAISAAELARPEAALAGIEIRLELDGGGGRVEVDTERMRQVLINLVRNAIEALNGSGGTLTLRTRSADAAGNARIEVEDDGPGFTDDSRIFDAFFTTKEGGTGLGLAIAFRIVADHGGSLQAESRPGSTCFAIELPARSSG